jgi:hypothetical protein
MKKIKYFELNDCLDGVIIAKSLKHAIKLIAPYYGYSVHEILQEIKRYENDRWSDSSFGVTYEARVAKKKGNKKSCILGWSES